MSQPEKPTAKDTSNPPASVDKPLPDAALEKVSGGTTNVSVSEITITKTTDKSTPTLGG